MIRIPRDLRHLAHTARAAGWSIEQKGSGHLHWRSPEGDIAGSALTPSSPWRQVRQVRADLRRAGLAVGQGQ